MLIKILITLSLFFLISEYSLACGCNNTHDINIGASVFEGELLEMVDGKKFNIENEIKYDISPDVLNFETQNTVLKFKINNIINGDFDDIIYIRFRNKGSTSCDSLEIPNILHNNYRIAVTLTEENGTKLNPASTGLCFEQKAL
ncbi:hypothetical protein TYM08_P3600 [Marinicellulosiphila megalodicopiae]